MASGVYAVNMYERQSGESVVGVTTSACGSDGCVGGLLSQVPVYTPTFTLSREHVTGSVLSSVDRGYGNVTGSWASPGYAGRMGNGAYSSGEGGSVLGCGPGVGWYGPGVPGGYGSVGWSSVSTMGGYWGSAWPGQAGLPLQGCGVEGFVPVFGMPPPPAVCGSPPSSGMRTVSPFGSSPHK